MTNPTPDRNETIIRSILFIAVVIIAVAVIVYLKRSTDVPLTPEGIAARDSVQRMASPDTTSTPAENAPTLDSTTEQASDTVSVDQRLPSDAGYEDGYFAGLQDGLDDMERASYDDSSKFPTAEQRSNYTDAYKRGYAQGFADGQAQGDAEQNLKENAENDIAAPKIDIPTTKNNATKANSANSSNAKSNTAKPNTAKPNTAKPSVSKPTTPHTPKTSTTVKTTTPRSK